MWVSAPSWEHSDNCPTFYLVGKQITSLPRVAITSLSSLAIFAVSSDKNLNCSILLLLHRKNDDQLDGSGAHANTLLLVPVPPLYTCGGLQTVLKIFIPQQVNPFYLTQPEL